MNVRLCDVAEFSKGRQINGDDLIPGGEYPFLNGGVEPSGRWNSWNVPSNSIAISEGGNSCGYVNYMQMPFWCGAHCYFLHHIRGDVRYLFYALKSQQDRLMRIRSGACMPNIKTKDLAAFEFRYDKDPQRQQDVIQRLSLLSAIIRTREGQLVQLGGLAKSRFVEMFGDPVANPYKYEIAKLSEVSTDISAGGDKPTDTESIPSEIYPYPVFANGLENDGLQCYARSYTINQSALTVSARGTIGYTFIRAPFFTPIVRLITVIPNQRVSLIYLKHAIDAMNLIVSGTSQAQLTVPNFKRLEILVPPLSLQTIFAAFIERLDKSEFTIRQSLAQLNTLYRSLLQEYFG